MKLPDNVREFIEHEASRCGYQIVDMGARGRASSIEVVLDKEGGISMGECAQFNSKISLWIEENDIFKGDYTVDTCSPGLDRELKTESEFEWAAGKKVEVKVKEPVEKKSVISGKLVKKDVSGTVIIESDDCGEICIEKDSIFKVKLKVEI
ncbi:MAG: hypothetical protein P9L90_02675 [Candidatus Aadella gelida]|nr:hypothetical protein [Candidatus Aadella gelida]